MAKNIFLFKKSNHHSVKKNEGNKKFTLPQLVWMGFNYTCGISFTAVYTTMLLSNGKGESLGLNLIWIFLLEGLVAGSCAWAFARLSQVHPSGNGAAYIYVRTSWGKFWGWIISILQYSLLPIAITTQIVSMIRLNFVGSDTFLDTSQVLGSWAPLVWDVVGVIIFLLVSSVIFFGIKQLKKWLSISSYLKWGSTGLLILALIVMCILSGTSNWTANNKVSTLNVNNFSSAFTSCFFFFIGFETYSTIGKNVVNPEKNIGRSIIWTIALTIIFYVTTTILMLGAIGINFSSNPNLEVFNLLGKKMGSWVYYLGVIIMLICTIALKSNAAIQNTLYAGATLQPHAVEGILPEKFNKLDKDNLPISAAKLNMFISVLFACLWLFIPDAIQGFTNSSNDVISYSALTGEVSLIMLFVYIFVILTALKLGFQKKMKIKLWEIIIWILLLAFLLWQFAEFFIGLGQGLAQGISKLHNGSIKDHNDGIAEIVSNAIELLYIVLVVIFVVIWYFTYYRKKYLLRLKNDPQIQKKLDSEFYIADDWSYIVKKINDELNNYIIRNENIFENKDNHGLEDAKHLLLEFEKLDKE